MTGFTFTKNKKKKNSYTLIADLLHSLGDFHIGGNKLA